MPVHAYPDIVCQVFYSISTTGYCPISKKDLNIGAKGKNSENSLLQGFVVSLKNFYYIIQDIPFMFFWKRVFTFSIGFN